ncbi:hypothetical protein [Acinetobacter boissieri]|uniref:Uncharacterized protein n=1 Tax=Acinetobacter boissieri TaxID=1219383 RepID=A0A1G6GYR9_9GAMM|nr:hypothetical protein [Acinetobacter boissieri]SDB86825.1 hypothetical protein SAMN05421733_1039 [Acinetobacter boissieri]
MFKNQNLWILTEEYPKPTVIQMIVGTFCQDRGNGVFFDNIRIIPILDKNNFLFTYEILGINTPLINKIFIKIATGYSSFVDFLVFYQDYEPTQLDIPVYVIEETKTTDKESRNTGVSQRSSKFSYVHSFYPNAQKIMLYSLRNEENQTLSDTNIFGSRLLTTQGVRILGKNRTDFLPFTSIDELISAKNSMRNPPAGNVPIKITQYENKIQISGRLFKSDSLSHDPNIGTLSSIAYTLRVLGYQGQIEITHHGLFQKHVQNGKNKFIRIAQILGITLEGLQLPSQIAQVDYWRYDTKGEKLGTIFIHLLVENFSEGFSIFDNHAGSEKGYFFTPDGQYLSLIKYEAENREAYKAGDKTKIVYIPDLILLDPKQMEVINVEGKVYSNMLKGISELNNYDPVERLYINRYYPDFKVLRTVVLYGSFENQITRAEVSFLLNKDGNLILGIQAPDLFKRALQNLYSYWH